MEYALSRIVGRGQAEILLCSPLSLPQPAAQLLEARKTVLIDRLDLTPGNALVQGRLRVLWVYQAEDPGAQRPRAAPGSPVLRLSAGHVHGLTAEIALQLRIGVEGARPGMAGRVVDAFVTADASLFPNPGTIVDRSVVLIEVEVTEPEVRRLPAARPSVVAAPTSGRRIT